MNKKHTRNEQKSAGGGIRTHEPLQDRLLKLPRCDSSMPRLYAFDLARRPLHEAALHVGRAEAGI